MPPKIQPKITNFFVVNPPAAGAAPATGANNQPAPPNQPPPQPQQPAPANQPPPQQPAPAAPAVDAPQQQQQQQQLEHGVLPKEAGARRGRNGDATQQEQMQRPPNDADNTNKKKGGEQNQQQQQAADEQKAGNKEANEEDKKQQQQRARRIALVEAGLQKETTHTCVLCIASRAGGMEEKGWKALESVALFDGRCKNLERQSAGAVKHLNGHVADWNKGKESTNEKMPLITDTTDITQHAIYQHLQSAEKSLRCADIHVVSYLSRTFEAVTSDDESCHRRVLPLNVPKYVFDAIEVPGGNYNKEPGVWHVARDARAAGMVSDNFVFGRRELKGTFRRLTAEPGAYQRGMPGNPGIGIQLPDGRWAEVLTYMRVFDDESGGGNKTLIEIDEFWCYPLPAGLRGKERQELKSNHNEAQLRDDLRDHVAPRVKQQMGNGGGWKALLEMIGRGRWVPIQFDNEK